MSHTGLRELLTAVLSGHRLELDDLEVAVAGRRRVIRVTVDGDGRLGRGPDLDEIADATRDISSALDESDVLGEAPYTLEVSSRGVSRPLTLPAHYRRNIGRLLAVALAGGEHQTGRIAAADDETVTLDLSGDVSGAVQVHRLDQIAKAVVQVEMTRRLDEADQPDTWDDPGELADDGSLDELDENDPDASGMAEDSEEE